MNAPAAGHAPSQPNLLPPAARRQVDEANRLIAELNTTPAQPSTTSVAQAPRAEWTPATPAPARPPGVNEPAPTAQPSPPAHVRAAQPAVQPTPPAPPQPETEADRLTRLEQAYRVLQGKYNSETAGLRALSQQQSELINNLVRDQRPAAAPAPVVQQTPEDYMRSLGATDKEIEDYGELLPIVVKMAQNMVRPTINKLENELTQLRNQTGNTAQTLAKNAEMEVQRSLDSAIPNWRVINELQEFLDWLDVFDIFSGATRRVALASAYKNHDAARVVGIFQAYVREYPNSASASNGPPVELETLMAPEIRGEAPRAPEGAGVKRIISEKEVRDFYTRVRKKQVSPEEYERFQAELALATTEGRVRPDARDHHLNGR